MLPNFIIPGVAKAGTTSLYYYLDQHPEIDIPRKETFFFARDFYSNHPDSGPPYFRDKSRIVFTETEYNKFYAHCNKKAVGEVSTCYAYFYKQSIPAIKQKLGDVKIIFLLRNPVERAFSAYKHFVRIQKEPLSFSDALLQEKTRMEMRWDFMWYYSHLGFYAKQVTAYKNNFTNVDVFFSEDLQKNPDEILRKIFKSINVSEDVKINTTIKYNMSDERLDNFRSNYLYGNLFSKKIIRPALKRIIPEKKRQLLKYKWRTPAALLPNIVEHKIKNQLQNVYREDIKELEKITGRDLSGWLI